MSKRAGWATLSTTTTRSRGFTAGHTTVDRNADALVTAGTLLRGCHYGRGARSGVGPPPAAASAGVLSRSNTVAVVAGSDHCAHTRHHRGFAATTAPVLAQGPVATTLLHRRPARHHFLLLRPPAPQRSSCGGGGDPVVVVTARPKPPTARVAVRRNEPASVLPDVLPSTLIFHRRGGAERQDSRRRKWRGRGRGRRRRGERVRAKDGILRRDKYLRRPRHPRAQRRRRRRHRALSDSSRGDRGVGRSGVSASDDPVGARALHLRPLQHGDHHVDERVAAQTSRPGLVETSLAEDLRG